MYKSKLSIKETQLAIQDLKFAFTKKLNKEMNLTRVSAPLFVKSNTFINDGLSGEEPVKFSPKGFDETFEIVHSLAKWKRMALKKYGFDIYEGIWSDMNAIRQQETVDYLHSFYVDQWDWEMIINKEDRNINFLKSTVENLYKCIRYVENKINFLYPTLEEKLPTHLVFISADELQKRYPLLKPEERENEFAKQNHAFFVYGIGYPLVDGEAHSSRAFDYDDWTLNGDLIFYDKVNNKAIEISSMGIRVDASALKKQAKFLNTNESKFGEYHQLILKNKLPYTIGGGIGQSRLSMFLLEKKHIGEVQVGIWPDEELKKIKEKNITLL